MDEQQRIARAKEVRRQSRAGEWQGQTAGATPGVLQGNLAIVPARWAKDFEAFCHANPKPCPLIGKSPKPGDPMLPDLGEDIDIRTDVPRYTIFRDGKPVEETTDLLEHWRDDLVAFVLGCSFSFEEALVEAGVRLRHLELGTDVPVFKTAVQTTPVGPFGGSLVVSMRPFAPQDVPKAVAITGRFPRVHGAPVQVGAPEEIGVHDVTKPDWGSALPVEEEDVPVFWACGVTPQMAIEHARLPFCITHKPGHMLITDRLNAEFNEATRLAG